MISIDYLFHFILLFINKKIIYIFIHIYSHFISFYFDFIYYIVFITTDKGVYARQAMRERV